MIGVLREDHVNKQQHTERPVVTGADREFSDAAAS